MVKFVQAQIEKRKSKNGIWKMVNLNFKSETFDLTCFFVQDMKRKEKKKQIFGVKKYLIFRIVCVCVCMYWTYINDIQLKYISMIFFLFSSFCAFILLTSSLYFPLSFLLRVYVANYWILLNIYVCIYVVYMYAHYFRLETVSQIVNNLKLWLIRNRSTKYVNILRFGRNKKKRRETLAKNFEWSVFVEIRKIH